MLRFDLCTIIQSVLDKVPLVRPAAFQLNSVDKNKHTDILDVTAV